MNLSYKFCTPNDLEVLIDISVTTFVSAFEKHNHPEEFKAYMATAFSHKRIRMELLNPNSRFYLVYGDEVLVGYFKLNMGDAQTEPLGTVSVEIERIYVLEQFQGLQIGKQMLLKIIDMAKEQQLEFIWLGVWEMNIAAIRFYERHGFVKFGSHPYYVGNDKQTDWMMRLDLI